MHYTANLILTGEKEDLLSSADDMLTTEFGGLTFSNAMDYFSTDALEYATRLTPEVLLDHILEHEEAAEEWARTHKSFAISRLTESKELMAHFGVSNKEEAEARFWSFSGSLVYGGNLPSNLAYSSDLFFWGRDAASRCLSMQKFTSWTPFCGPGYLTNPREYAYHYCERTELESLELADKHDMDKFDHVLVDGQYETKDGEPVWLVGVDCHC